MSPCSAYGRTRTPAPSRRSFFKLTNQLMAPLCAPASDHESWARLETLTDRWSDGCCGLLSFFFYMQRKCHGTGTAVWPLGDNLVSSLFQLCSRFQNFRKYHLTCCCRFQNKICAALSLFFRTLLCWKQHWKEQSERAKKKQKRKTFSVSKHKLWQSTVKIGTWRECFHNGSSLVLIHQWISLKN